MVGQIPTTCHIQKHQDQGDPFGNYKATGAGFCPINRRGVVVWSCQYWIFVGKKHRTWRLISLGDFACWADACPWNTENAIPRYIPSHRPAFGTISRKIPGIMEGRGILTSTIVQHYSHYSCDDLNETNSLFIFVTSSTSKNSHDPFASEILSSLKYGASPNLQKNKVIFAGRVSTKPSPQNWVFYCYQGHAFRIHFQLLKPWMVGASASHVGCAEDLAAGFLFASSFYLKIIEKRYPNQEMQTCIQWFGSLAT